MENYGVGWKYETMALLTLTEPGACVNSMSVSQASRSSSRHGRNPQMSRRPIDIFKVSDVFQTNPLIVTAFMWCCLFVVRVCVCVRVCFEGALFRMVQRETLRMKPFFQGVPITCQVFNAWV